MSEEARRWEKKRSTSPRQTLKKARALKIKPATNKTSEARVSRLFVVSQSMGKVRDLASDSIQDVAQEHKYGAVFSREAVSCQNLDITDE